MVKLEQAAKRISIERAESEADFGSAADVRVNLKALHGD
jgi:hypothetical protein